MDLNPLYERPHESALAFGRGARAGVDRRVVAEEGAKRQMALVSQSRRDLGIGRVTDEEASRLFVKGLSFQTSEAALRAHFLRAASAAGTLLGASS